MSRLPLTFVLTAALVASAGCATAPAPVGSPVDAEYVASVEKAASRTGTRVIWVNPPDKIQR